MEENLAQNTDKKSTTLSSKIESAENPTHFIQENQAVKEIDLNVLFPGEDKNLNDLFPEEEMRVLLKKVEKNRKDIALMHERFQSELELAEEKTDDISSSERN